MSDAGATGIRHPFAEPPETGTVTEIAEGVLWIRLPMPMSLDHVNVYALDDGDGWTIVDTGLSTSKTRAIWEALLSGPLTGKPVRRVLATHHHPDHIGLAGWFRDSFGAEVVTTRTAWLYARMLTLDVQLTPTSETLGFWAAAGMDPALHKQRAGERPFNFADCVAPLPLGYRRIAEGDHLCAGGRRWRIETHNGHAPEHAVLFSEDDDLVLAGDQLLPRISPNISVHAAEPDADPLGDWLASCRALAAGTRGQDLILCGHKLPFHGRPFRARQLIENHESALERVMDFLQPAPATAAACFAPLFRREIADSEYVLALGEAVAHLNHLLHRGMVRRRVSLDGVWLWDPC